jgi:hypothetical protein
MAVLGHLICCTCKQQTCIGKWLRKDARGFGFWRGGVSYEELGLKVLNFLAQHTNHDVRMLSDGKYDELSMTEPLDEYENVEDRLRVDWPADARRE